jgi:hypothetical protein
LKQGAEIVSSITSWADFWQTFGVSILVSLLGALIGYYAKNGVIQFPLIVIPYQKSPWLIRWLDYRSKWGNELRRMLVVIFCTPVDLLLFIIGFRSDETDHQRVYLELGFLGNILIGIGTGVLSKAAIEIAGSQSTFAEVSAAFIAGFAGLSYIQALQQKDLGITSTPLNPSVSAQAVVPASNATNNSNTTTSTNNTASTNNTSNPNTANTTNNVVNPNTVSTTSNLSLAKSVPNLNNTSNPNNSNNPAIPSNPTPPIT